MNRMIREGLVMLVAGLLALPIGAMAASTSDEQAGSMTEVEGQEPLTDDIVERYLASMRDMRALAREIEEGDEDPSEDEMAAFQERQDAILEEHGFEGRGEWMGIHERVFQAAMAVGVQREMSDRDLESEVEEQRVQIREHPDLSDEQKETMLNQLDQQLESYREMRDHPDAEVVEPYFDEFREVFGEGM